MVYVLNKNGQPLMPTNRHGKVRRLLKSGQAKVIKRCPFTIQLLYDSTTHTQPITLGVDAGSKHIGLCASSETKVLYQAECLCRTDIVDLLSTRREFRRTRRNHKTRYRKPRFMNRIKSKQKGWLTPSVENKIGMHLTIISKIRQILPITKVVIEVAQFDTQMLKALDNGLDIPQDTDYQQGEQLGFWNVREYVLFRDGHKCQCCKDKSKDSILNVHHIESRKTGGNSPSNLITLCETCHKKYHKGLLPNFKPKRQASYRDAAFMGIVRWEVYNRLKIQNSDIAVKLTYGYITKNARITNGVEKSHISDAFCIANNLKAKPLNEKYLIKKVRCHNRQIHKATINKGGYRKLNQAPYEVKGFKLFDRVRIQNTEGFVFGRRRDGRLTIRLLDGTKLNEQISYKKVIKLENAKYYLTERRSHSAAGQAHAVPVAK